MLRRCDRGRAGGPGGHRHPAAERLRALAALFDGEFLEGLEIERHPAFNGWLVAQRRRFRGCHAAVLEHLVGAVPDDEAFGYLDRWLALAPFDQRVHEMLLNALARRGRIRDGEEHLAATVRLFEGDGLDFAPDPRGLARCAGAPPNVVPVRTTPAAADAPADGAVARIARRASIAVMPFVDAGASHTRGGAADALAHDVITRLAKLRSLFVIAQGSVFALHERQIGPEEAGRMLNVDYVVSGSLQRHGKRLTVAVELAEARTARIVWAETFNQKRDDAFLVLDEIGNRIVASDRAARSRRSSATAPSCEPPNSLDAWEAHHRGLWHMYRFNRADNERAPAFLPARRSGSIRRSRAPMRACPSRIGRTPSRAGRAREPEIDQAFEAAGQSLMVDDRDPAAHWAMGRALWLRGRHDQSLLELEQASTSARTSRSATTRWPSSTRSRAIRRPRSRRPTTRAT